MLALGEAYGEYQVRYTDGVGGSKWEMSGNMVKTLHW